jgi:hypothetical protein
LIFSFVILLPFVKFFFLPFFRFFDLAFYCLFSFFLIWFFIALCFPLLFRSCFVPIFFSHVVSCLAYPNLLGNKRLGCCCCYCCQTSLAGEHHLLEETQNFLRYFCLFLILLDNYLERTIRLSSTFLIYQHFFVLMICSGWSLCLRSTLTLYIRSTQKKLAMKSA